MNPIALIPTPLHYEDLCGWFVFPTHINVVLSHQELNPLGKLLIEEFESITRSWTPSFSFTLDYLSTTNSESLDKPTVLLSLDNNIPQDQYSLIISDHVELSAGSYDDLAFAVVSLLQLITQDAEYIKCPTCVISDHPFSSYRGILVDVARKPHNLDTLKAIVIICHWYKIKYLHIHFTDNQAFTFPSKAYPKLVSRKNHFSWEELVELEEFASIRGITIIPELDMPGHSRRMVKSMKKIFGIKAKPKNDTVINMGRDAVYNAIDTIIGEFCSIFRKTPYFHIGADEVNLKGIGTDENIQAYMKKNDLNSSTELYRHFIIRVNQIVKKHGKQTCIWEGFHREGRPEIPKDILVYEFETLYNLPNHLVEDGYTVVNTSWLPLYITPHKHWSWEEILTWNIYRWQNLLKRAPAYHPIQMEPTNLIIGAQLCSWEQKNDQQISSIRKRAAAFAEFTWKPFELLLSSEKEEDSQKILAKIDHFRLILAENDHRLQFLLQPYS